VRAETALLRAAGMASGGRGQHAIVRRVPARVHACFGDPPYQRPAFTSGRSGFHIGRLVQRVLGDRVSVHVLRGDCLDWRGLNDTHR
jgi:hypothetical protein